MRVRRMNVTALPHSGTLLIVRVTSTDFPRCDDGPPLRILRKLATGRHRTIMKFLTMSMNTMTRVLRNYHQGINVRRLNFLRTRRVRQINLRPLSNVIRTKTGKVSIPNNGFRNKHGGRDLLTWKLLNHRKEISWSTRQSDTHLPPRQTAVSSS